ncbi:MAG: hypothetical protein HEQ35_30820 [Gloeotrichia echinulata IR180]
MRQKRFFSKNKKLHPQGDEQTPDFQGTEFLHLTYPTSVRRSPL